MPGRRAFCIVELAGLVGYSLHYHRLARIATWHTTHLLVLVIHISLSAV